MTSPTDPTNPEFEEQLRQILKAEADTVAPRGEALQLIRDRTDRHRDTSWFGLPWLRPALAVAGAGLIAASVVMSTPQVRDQVLDIVPAGANREGTPPEEDLDGPGIAAPDPTTDSDTAPAERPDDPAEEPAPSPTEEETDSDEDGGVGATATCAPTRDETPSSTADGEEESTTEPEEGQEECDPTEEPSQDDGDGGEEPTDPGTDPGTGDEEPDPGDGSTGSGDGGSTPTTGDGTTSTKSSEE